MNQSDLSDLDQVFYIGPYSFSIKQVLKAVYHSKDYNLNVRELFIAYRNLIEGEGQGNIDFQRFCVQLGFDIELVDDSLTQGIDSLFSYNKNLDVSNLLDNKDDSHNFLSIDRKLSSIQLIWIFMKALLDYDNFNESCLDQIDVILLDKYLRNKGFKPFSKNDSRSGSNYGSIE